MSLDQGDTEKLEQMRMLLDLESARYIAGIGILQDNAKRYSVPLSAYVMCCSMALPVKTIMVGERPYATDIHPPISSAMSYDLSKCRPTPSTVGAANDLNRNTGYPYTKGEAWFRDSWKYLRSGVVVVNCTVVFPYTSSYSTSETVLFQRWLRCIIECSSTITDSPVDVICMGVPAQNIVDATLSSMDKHKGVVRKKTYPNPASWVKRSHGDTRSLTYTFGKKGTCTSILSAIHRSTLYPPLEVQDYIEYMSKPVPSQLLGVTRLMEKGKSLVDQIEEAYAELDSNHKVPALTEAYEEFSKALVSYRDSVLYDIVRASVSQSQQEKKIGKNTEWGSKAPWSKPPASVGESTRMSTVPEDTGGVEQAFDDGEVVPFADESPEPEQKPQEKPRKKKVIKKKVPKRPKPEATESIQAPSTLGEKSTKAGDRLSSTETSTLGSSIYFISEIGTEASLNLREQLDSSMSTNTATTKDIGTIVDAAALDLATHGKSAAESLGLADGEVCSDCVLPKLLSKLCEA